MASNARTGKYTATSAPSEKGQKERKKTANEEKGENYTWKCPKCTLVIRGSTSRMVTWRKDNHLRLKCGFEGVGRRNALNEQVPTPSSRIPDEQMAWQCPLCSHKLPELGRDMQTRAVSMHAEVAHGMTGIELRTLRQKKKEGSYAVANKRQSEAMTKKHAEERARAYPGHKFVTVVVDCKTWPAKRKDNDKVIYCSKCMRCIGTDLKGVPCRTAKTANGHQRNWWAKLNQAGSINPLRFSKALGQSMEELNRFFGVSAESPAKLVLATARDNGKNTGVEDLE